ncbi:pyrroline-5-carboxylate reductase [Salsuginibacillus kocurii]|uniref:pyrroline-5-carboxylate reductase n=1 Tax=Salsuginibacillus kocurii TaxID=427078 RepID=UPI00035E5F7C|nr:pyrroline-5-carboxylate reductase [Salsuginibacillus kocurii]
MLENTKITFIGAGSMAESMIGGFIQEKLIQPGQITAINKENHPHLETLQKKYDIQTTTNLQEAMTAADIVILAVKPKHSAEVMEKLREYLTPSQLLVSVLAGVPTSYLQELSQSTIPIIRAMPNTSAKVGASATAISAGEHAVQNDIQIARLLFSAIGSVTIVEEEQLNAVTGVSGSGPAYVYYIAEGIQQAAHAAGLTDTQSRELIVQTLYGAAKRLKYSDKSARELYQEVMSPGGTTEAAFKELESYQVQQGIEAGVQQAVQRAIELGQIPSNLK